MNKVFIGLILAVCVLGMALVMLNDRLGRKTETAQPAQPTHTAPMPRSPEEMAAAARAMELAQARSALSGPEAEENAQPVEAAPQEEARRPKAAPEPRPALEPASKPELPRPRPAVREQAQPKPAPAAQPAPAEQPRKPEPVQKQELPKTETAQAPEAATPPAAPAKAAPAGGKTATRFVVYARDKGATVRIGGNSKVDYSSMTLENPNRVVVDLAGDWKFPPNPGVPKNDLVSSVRVGQNGDKTRVVIDLKIKPRKVILVPFKSGDGVDVRVDK